MRMFGLLPRSLRKIFAEVSHHACILPQCSLPQIFMCPDQKQTNPEAKRNPNTTGICPCPRKAVRNLSGFRPFRAVFAPAGGPGETGWPFRRNGITVPAQRHRRSGATGWPFRRNAWRLLLDIPPAQSETSITVLY